MRTLGRRLLLPPLAVLALAGALVAGWMEPAGAASGTQVVGRSVAGRDITVIHRAGAGPVTRTLVVIGQIHGNETAGLRVVDALATAALPDGLDLWLVPTLNPDGLARGTRTNVRGVDLNRNFARSWRRTASSGRSRASEPETRAAMALLRQLSPDAVVSFHQALYGVDTSEPRTRALAKALARSIRLPRKAFRCSRGCHGTLTQWFNATQRGRAVTVELNARPSRALIARAASGSLAAAMALPGSPGPAPTAPTPTVTAPTVTPPPTVPPAPGATPEVSVTPATSVTPGAETGPMTPGPSATESRMTP